MKSPERARVFTEATSILTLALEKQSSANASSGLARELAQVARQMEPLPAARVLTLLLEKTTDANARFQLAQGLAGVTERMEPPEAARVSKQVANILTRALEKEANADDRNQLTLALVSESEQTEPDKAAQILIEALEKETNALRCESLAHFLALVLRRLSREEAFMFCQQAMQRLAQAAEIEKRGYVRARLARAVASLLSASDDTDAGRVLPNLAFAAFSVRTEDDYFYLDSLRSLFTNDSRSEVSRRSMAVATVVGLVNPSPLAALPPLPAASEPLPCRLSTQDLVELLKMPTCFGEARKVVLKHLGNRYGRAFANHWEFVRFAQEQHLDLDLTSPPKRWRRP